MTEAPPALPVQRVEKMTCDVNQTDDQYGAVVRQMQKAIRAGEIFQVVPSRRFSLPCPSPLAAYDVLKKSNPSPYMFFMQDNDFTLFGASPESSLKYDATSRQIEIYPIAGPARAAVAPTARWIAISTAASSWKCVPTIKSSPST
jgi:anthranilate synthase component 1